MTKAPDLRLAIAEALYPTSANLLPAVCLSFGLAPGTRDEAMSSKRVYVQTRLVSLPLPKVLEIARNVVEEYPHDGLTRAIERAAGDHPADATIAGTLTAFSEAGVHAVWKRALERRQSDPEGALTSARTLLETVCKHILEASGQTPDEKDDLPTLYRNVARILNVAPDQHTEQAFKRILGSCQSVVEGLGTIRNKLGDAHGKGPKPAKPAPRHAALAVNLAGSMATFLVETWNARRQSAAD